MKDSRFLQSADAAARSSDLRRRDLLAGMGALLAAPALSPFAAGAAIPPFRGRLGALEVMVVSDGTLNVPISFTYPSTPAGEVSRLFAAHGMPPEGLPPQTNVTLVKTGNDLVLIDAGSGPKFQPTAGKLSENLEAAGINPESITRVVFTHGHADHLWGAIDDFDDGERFPKASYVISSIEWDFWTHPETPGRAPDWMKGMAIGSARILRKLEKKIERRKEGDMVAPGLTYYATPGHTPGHMSVLLESGNQRLLVGGDVVNNNAASFARPDWPMGSDLDRDQGIATRRRLLDALAAERIPLIGFHLSWPGHGRVERSGSAYRFVTT